jgi:hypothetical protein
LRSFASVFGAIAPLHSVFPPVLLGLAVLSLASYARRRKERLEAAMGDFPDAI